MDAAGFHTQEGRLEEGLGASEALVADGDYLSVGQFVGLLQGGGGGGGDHLLLEVEGDIAKLLLDVSHDFSLSGGGERVTSLGEDLHEVVSQIPSCQVKTEDGVWEGVPFVDGHGVGDTISGVQDDSGGSTGSVQREDGLDGHVHGGRVEGLEHDLGHLLPVGLRVQGGFRQEDGVLFRGNSEFVVEGVMPDLLHVIPIGNNTVLDGVLECKDTSLALGFVTDVGILLSHSYHHTLMSGSTDDGGEDGSGSIISGETGLAHTGSIVNNKSGYIVVTHFYCRMSLPRCG